MLYGLVPCHSHHAYSTQLACAVFRGCAESLELRILEALAGVYPRTLNGAQLAKLCGHFKLKSKVCKWRSVRHMGLLLLCVRQLHVQLCLQMSPAWQRIKHGSQLVTAITYGLRGPDVVSLTSSWCLRPPAASVGFCERLAVTPQVNHLLYMKLRVQSLMLEA
jgi:hypothetical protein